MIFSVFGQYISKHPFLITVQSNFIICGLGFCCDIRPWKFCPVSVHVFSVGNVECGCVKFFLIQFNSLCLSTVIFRPLTFDVISGKTDLMLLFGALFQSISSHLLLSHALPFPFLFD